MAYFVQFFTLILNLYSNRVQLLPPTHKSTKTVEKSPYFGLDFLETGTEIEKTLQSNPTTSVDDSKTPFGLILALMGFSKNYTF